MSGPHERDTLHGPRAVVLLSGGLDSATVLAIARAEHLACHCICFDYGQRHHWELPCAQRVAQQLGAASIRTIKLDLRSIGGSALTTDDIAVPKDAFSAAGEVPVTYVPARNLIFLSIACGLAEVVGARDVFIGVSAVDFSGYPDCRPEFIESFESTVNLATRIGAASPGPALRIRTPLVAMSKAETILAGSRLGVDYSLTHSCYDPVVSPGDSAHAPIVLACGHCDSCALRRRGFAEARVSDPTRYAP